MSAPGAFAGSASSGEAAALAMCDRPGCVAFARPGLARCAVHDGLARGKRCAACAGTGRLDLAEPCPKCCGVGVRDDRRKPEPAAAGPVARGVILEWLDRCARGELE